MLLVSYDTVLRDKSVLSRLGGFQAAILDEAHRLRTAAGATRGALMALGIRWWLLLTGARLLGGPASG